MNYAFRLGLVHFMRRDPNGIRRDPRRARGKIQLFPLTSCKTDGARCRIRRDPRWRDIMKYAFRLGLVMRRDPNGIRRDRLDVEVHCNSIQVHNRRLPFGTALIFRHDEEGSQGYETLEPHAN